MSWSAVQQMRLGIEKDILDDELKNVTWYNETSAGNTRVDWHVNTNNGRSYTLCIYIPKDFPNECPIMVVSGSPYGSPLKTRSGSPLTAAHLANHIYDAYNGFTQICHYKHSLWSNDNTLCQVFMKGRLWLEAYEGHLESGASLDAYLPHMS